MLKTPLNANQTRTHGLKMLAAGVLVAVSATVAMSSWAQPGPRGDGPGFGGPDRGAPHGLFMGGPRGGNPDRMVDRLLDGLNASDAQRSQVKQIVRDATKDLRTQREANRGLRDKGMALLAAPTVDASALESLRKQEVAQHDQASRRMTQALLDISKVLTPEQRAKLGDRIKQRGDQMRERKERMEREHPRAPKGEAPKQ